MKHCSVNSAYSLIRENAYCGDFVREVLFHIAFNLGCCTLYVFYAQRALTCDLCLSLRMQVYYVWHMLSLFLILTPLTKQNNLSIFDMDASAIYVQTIQL